LSPWAMHSFNSTIVFACCFPPFNVWNIILS
jgi:hypothetical protein